MSNLIIGTCGHIDHGKTSLIKALNGFDGDSTKEEKKRGITIDLSFSNITKGEKNIAFIDVPGHERLVKNMIAGAFGFDCVLIVVSAFEGIKPQTIDHLEILKLLGVRDAVLVLSKKDLVSVDELEAKLKDIEEFVKSYEFDIKFSMGVSVFDEDSIIDLRDNLFKLEASSKEEENFFRYYVDRAFSLKGAGTVVTGSVLGKPIAVNEKLFICDLQKEIKVKNLQVHESDVEVAKISNRAAINISGLDAKSVQRGFIISKKGYLRGFKSIDISFSVIADKALHHNRNYSIYIGSKKLDAKILLFNSEDSLQSGYANIKSDEEIFSIFGEKIIIRDGNVSVAGGVVLNPIHDPMKKQQKLLLLEALDKKDIAKAYEILTEVHKKGLGLISSAQRFALSHSDALKAAKELKNSFIDEKELVIYPLSTKDLIYKNIKNIYTKNQYALLSNSSIKLRLKWASEGFIEVVLDELEEEGFLIKDANLYRSNEIKEDFTSSLLNIVLERLEKESLAPTAPYNIYDDLDLDRKMGDDILKRLCAKKQVIRLQHNIFIHHRSLGMIVDAMKSIIKKDGYVDLANLKEKYDLSRKYLIAYLEYLDNFSDITRDANKRVFNSSF
ncbi:MAG: selenocysteine-specific translation elongation factor [Sulfurimonas sp.]|uniref:selenocysteine-specific translation elongation factor n=1 Tax=Sulfurimonas sp. TaxID=2022749 RepID=UPI0025DA1210|nr:selenocysteine-specific translation elongation factor [Sulfurimonas sp.]MCK9490950.1 selenocysteine-specific translation elongation factor [Sulfurimonas sp.]